MVIFNFNEGTQKSRVTIFWAQKTQTFYSDGFVALSEKMAEHHRSKWRISSLVVLFYNIKKKLFKMVNNFSFSLPT